MTEILKSIELYEEGIITYEECLQFIRDYSHHKLVLINEINELTA